jgi:2-amino-4-hydroxy-6-hydroxymethyldihydropteridine diphosphokinase
MRHACIIFAPAGKISDINELKLKDRMNVAFLSLGGNVGDRENNLKKARQLLNAHCGRLTKVSSLYETEAWGHQSGNTYLNQVVKLETKLSPVRLMLKLQQIEQELGRKRTGKGYTDRTMDIDLLFYNQAIINQKTLTVPHPRLHLRRFVLEPFCEIGGSVKHPVLRQSIQKLLKGSADTLAVKRVKAQQNFYICVEGNIGSGKTTLGKALSAALGGHFVPELFEKSHLLPRFYETPRLYAFPLEYSFLISRFEQLRSIPVGDGKVIVSDFSIYKSLWFAKANLNKEEFRLFEKHFHAFVSELPVPDLIIHLTTNLPNLKRNIANRGRHFEKAIKDNYLLRLSKLYRSGFKSLKGPLVLEINIENYHSKLEFKSIKTIKKFLAESFGRQG